MASMVGSSSSMRIHSTKYFKSTECWAFYHARTGDRTDPNSILFTPGRDYLEQCGNAKAKSHANDLAGKFVLLVGLSTPDASKEMEIFWKNLPRVYHTICKEHASANDDLVLVLSIAKGPNAKAGITKDAFYQLLSETGFTSPLCLAVPYSDHKSRESVCENLGMPRANYACPSCYAVSKCGHVLAVKYSHLLERDSDCYPCTPDNLKLLRAEEAKLRSTRNLERLTLEYLLSPSWRPQTPRCSDDKPCSVLYDMTTPGSSTVSVPLSSLKDHVVGLYLCVNGKLMDKLYKVFKECKSKGKNFTVVMVYGPTGYEPDFESVYKTLNDKVSSLFENDDDSSGWFLFPLENKVATKLRYLCTHSSSHDELVVVAPSDDKQSVVVEPSGRLLATQFGLQAFPFTKATFRDAMMERLNALTLEDFLPASTKLTDVCGEESLLSDVVKVKKNILVYFTYLNLETPESKRLYKWYADLKSADRDDKFELILVNFGFLTHMSPMSVYPDPVPWLVTDASKDILKTVKAKLAPGYLLEDPLFAAFGDGKVLSLHASGRFHPLGSTAVFPTYSTLLEELKEQLNEKRSIEIL